MIKCIILYIGLVGVAVQGWSQRVTDTIPEKQSDSVIGPSRLRDTSLLKAVTVEARKVLIKHTLDGFVYNADNDVTMAAGNAIDVLRRIPLITIDMSGTPRVQGSSNIKVFIDNKPSEIYASSLADALRQIPAADIASVEVITQPSARYDAEGTDAVINITTKKSQYDGTAGRVETEMGNRSQHVGASVKWRKGHFIVSMEGHWYRYNNTTRSTLERTTDDGSSLQQQKDGRSIWNTYIARPTVTYMIDSLNSISAGYQLRDARQQFDNVLSSVVDHTSSYTRFTDNYFASHANMLNAVYTSVSRNKKRELNLMAFYFSSRERSGYDLQQEETTIVNYKERNNNQVGNREGALQADWSRSFDNRSKLEAGIKASWRRSESTSDNERYDFAKGDYYLDAIRSNRFDYDRSIYAAYVSYLLNLKKWSIRIGSRYEQTRLYALFKDTALRVPDFNNLVPNVLISRTLPGNQSLKFSYAGKVIRPYLYSLNPTINYVDSFNIEYGNPGLLPMIVHSFQLGYQFTKNKFTGGVSLTAGFRTRAIESVKTVKDGVVTTTFQNLGENEQHEANVNISYNDNRKVNASVGGGVQYIHYSSAALQLENTGWRVSGNTRFSYRFTKTLQAETAVQYYPPAITVQGTTGGWFFYSLVVNKKWWNDKLTMSCSAENFLTKYQNSRDVSRTDVFSQVTVNRYPVQFLKLGLSFKFGKKEIKEPPGKSAGEGE